MLVEVVSVAFLRPAAERSVHLPHNAAQSKILVLLSLYEDLRHK